ITLSNTIYEARRYAKLHGPGAKYTEKPIFTRTRFDISSGKDIENAISGICGTSVAHLEPDRKKDIRVKRLKKENIKAQLETRGILKDMNINRKELVKELESVLAKETLEKTLENLECSLFSSHVQNISNKDSNVSNNYVLTLSNNYILTLSNNYVLTSSNNYVLTSSKNQYLHEKGNVNKSERYTAESMLTQLRQCVENRVIEKDEVPKLETIQNRITRYANQHR
ncbi:21644_t:CDS:2, partial [Gigaspora margarita]